MANLHPEPHPENLTPGNPGNKGGGRKPDAWKETCRELASSEEVLELARKVLADDKHPAWLGAWKWLGEQAYGKAQSSVDMTAGGQPIKAYVLFDPEKDV